MPRSHSSHSGGSHSGGSTSGGASHGTPGSSGSGGYTVETSALHSMAGKLSNLGSNLDGAGTKMGSAHPGGDAFGVVGQAFGSKLGGVLDTAQQHVGGVAKGAYGAERKLRATATDIDDNEATISKHLNSIADPQKPPSTHNPGSVHLAKGPATGGTVHTPPSTHNPGPVNLAKGPAAGPAVHTPPTPAGTSNKRKRPAPGGSGSAPKPKRPRPTPPTWENPTHDGLYPDNPDVPYAGLYKDAKKHSKFGEQEAEHPVPTDVTKLPPGGQPSVSIPYDWHRGSGEERLGGVSSTGSGETAVGWRDRMAEAWNDPNRRHEAVRMGIIDNLNANPNSASGLHTVIEEHRKQGNLTDQQAAELQNEVADTYYRRGGGRH